MRPERLLQGLQLSPCVTNNTVVMEFVMGWCGDEEGEETCVLLFDLGSVMVDIYCSILEFVLRHCK